MDHHPRLVAFDLDGTLAESKQRMPAEMGELLSKLLKKMPVAIMSGAGFPQFEKQFFAALPVEANLNNLYIFPTNAAQCFIYRNDWKPQYDHAFSQSDRDEIHRAITDSLAEISMPTPKQIWGDIVQDRGAQITFSAVGQEASVAAKQEWAALYDSKRKELRNVLAEKLNNYSVSTGGITSIDITPKGVTKAYGIKRLSELTGIPVAQMLYVGDALEEGGNDAVVKDTGVPTHQVFGPEETAGLITSLLK